MPNHPLTDTVEARRNDLLPVIQRMALESHEALLSKLEKELSTGGLDSLIDASYKEGRVLGLGKLVFCALLMRELSQYLPPGSWVELKNPRNNPCGSWVGRYVRQLRKLYAGL